MSTTSLTAGEVMDRVAALMNDPAKTDYTYLAILPYLRMAFDELIESLEESNVSITNQKSTFITVPVGKDKIIPASGWEDSYPGFPTYPPDLVEIQGIEERTKGTNDSFIPLTRKEFINAFPVNKSFMFWSFEDQVINFNPNGANTIREILIKYISDYGMFITGPDDLIYVNNARSYLAYKTAAFCSFFIGENETRSGVLNEQADAALERLIGISNKGRQQIVTRHRPFRAGFKARGGY